MKRKRIAIDTSKHVFTLHGVDDQGRTALQRELKRHTHDARGRECSANRLEHAGPSHMVQVLGLGHHEGRCSPVFHHRATLSIAACGLVTSESSTGPRQEKPVPLRRISGQVLQCALVVPHGAEDGVYPKT